MKTRWFLFFILSPLASAQVDHGDFPEPYPDVTRVIDTRLFFGNPTEINNADPAIAGAPDAETEAQRNATATGDDASGADENPAYIVSQTDFNADPPSPEAPDIFARTELTFSVKNFTGSNASVQISIDYNQDGDFTDSGEPGGLGGVGTGYAGPLTFGFFVSRNQYPASGELILPARFTISALVNGETVGEIEDHFISFGSRPQDPTGFDFGDFPDIDSGTNAGGFGSGTRPDYRTRLQDNGPRHEITFDLFMREGFQAGLSVDAEDDAILDPDARGDDRTDEVDDIIAQFGFSGFSATRLNTDPPTVRYVGTLVVPVTSFNDTGDTAYLTAWGDFDYDGDFTSLEAATNGEVSINSGGDTQTVLSFPFDFTIPENCGTEDGFLFFPIRLRLSTESGLTPYGEAPDGEVVDQLFRFNICDDYGDLPDSLPGTAPGTFAEGGTLPDYRTRREDGGPSHVIRPGLWFGTTGLQTVDGEIFATTDDGPDEEGFFTAVTSQRTTVTGNDPVTATTDLTLFASLAVTNDTGQAAQATAWADKNLDGEFSSGELVHQVVVPGDNSVNEINFTINHSVDTSGVCEVDGTYYLPLRARLSTLPGLLPTGGAPDGEVEDHIIEINLQSDDFCVNNANPLGPVDGRALLGTPTDLTSLFIPDVYRTQLTTPNWFLNRTPLTGGLLSETQLAQVQAGSATLWVTNTENETGISPLISTVESDALLSALADLGVTGTDQAPHLDLDDDGFSTLEEFALGSNPTSSSSRPPVITRFEADSNTSANHLGILYLRRTGGMLTNGEHTADGVTIGVEATANLVNWNEMTEAITIPSGLPTPPDDYEWAFQRISMPETNLDTSFMRLRIE